jgi:hypothetical protein
MKKKTWKITGKQGLCERKLNYREHFQFHSEFGVSEKKTERERDGLLLFNSPFRFENLTTTFYNLRT